MLAHQAIRDVSRALTLLASEPQPKRFPPKLPAKERAGFFKAHAEGLRELHAVLHPLLDRAGMKLAAALDATDANEILDPEGEGSEALEEAEAFFNAQRDQLARMWDAFTEAGAPSDHDVFMALDSLAGLYAWIVATMQEVRWALLITDGVRGPKTARTFTAGAELVAALDE